MKKSKKIVPTDVSTEIFNTSIIYEKGENVNKSYGFVQLYRSFLKWEWYTDINTKVLFLHCLLRANHMAVKWRGYEIQRGQFISSLANLSIETGLSLRKVRTAFLHLETTGELTRLNQGSNTLITIRNYNKYQVSDTQIDTQMTQERHRSDTEATTNNNDNNDNNENNNIYIEKNKNFIIPKVSDIQKYCQSRKNSIDAQQFYDYYTSKGWLVGKTKMRDWQAAIRTWEKQTRKENDNSLSKLTGKNFVSKYEKYSKG